MTKLPDGTDLSVGIFCCKCHEWSYIKQGTFQHRNNICNKCFRDLSDRAGGVDLNSPTLKLTRKTEPVGGKWRP
jgi:hypothetical protein